MHVWYAQFFLDFSVRGLNFLVIVFVWMTDAMQNSGNESHYFRFYLNLSAIADNVTFAIATEFKLALIFA